MSLLDDRKEKLFSLNTIVLFCRKKPFCRKPFLSKSWKFSKYESKKKLLYIKVVSLQHAMLLTQKIPPQKCLWEISRNISDQSCFRRVFEATFLYLLSRILSKYLQMIFLSTSFLLMRKHLRAHWTILDLSITIYLIQN